MATVTPVGVHHLAFSVNDVEETVAFWTQHFGLAVVNRMALPSAGIHGAFVGGYGILLEIWQAEGSVTIRPERRSPGGDLKQQGTKHIAIRVADVQAAVDALFDAGVTFVGVQRSFGQPMQKDQDPTSRVTGRAPAVAAFILEPSGALVEVIGKAPFE